MGPSRLRSFLGSIQISKIYTHLSMLPQEELRSEVGPIRFMVSLPQIDALNAVFVESITEKLIVKDSFVDQYLLLDENSTAVYEEKPSKEVSYLPWSGLPRKLWVYLDE